MESASPYSSSGGVGGGQLRGAGEYCQQCSAIPRLWEDTGGCEREIPGSTCCMNTEILDLIWKTAVQRCQYSNPFSMACQECPCIEVQDILQENNSYACIYVSCILCFRYIYINNYSPVVLNTH